MSERDVKDASAGVLRDVKRFQLEKEDDLKRYMVWIRLIVKFYRLTRINRSRMPIAISTGRSGMLRPGGKPKRRLRRLMCGSS